MKDGDSVIAWLDLTDPSIYKTKSKELKKVLPDQDKQPKSDADIVKIEDESAQEKQNEGDKKEEKPSETDQKQVKVDEDLTRIKKDFFKSTDKIHS